MLRDPFWVLNAANELKVDVHWPVQYVHLSPSRVHLTIRTVY
jgi:hypothetical protein